MGNVEKLIIRAKESTDLFAPRLESAIIDLGKKQKYTARGFVRLKGKKEMWSHECDTVQQGVEHINVLAEQFPNHCSVMIALCCEAYEEWGVMEWQEESP